MKVIQSENKTAARRESGALHVISFYMTPRIISSSVIQRRRPRGRPWFGGWRNIIRAFQSFWQCRRERWCCLRRYILIPACVAAICRVGKKKKKKVARKKKRVLSQIDDTWRPKCDTTFFRRREKKKNLPKKIMWKLFISNPREGRI